MSRERLVTARNLAADLVVLHPSAAAHWWLSSGLHEKAEVLRQRLHAGAVRAFVLDDVDVYVTQTILWGVSGGLRLTAEARQLVEIDAEAEFARLRQLGAVMDMPATLLTDTVRPLAAAIEIAEQDAAYAVLAESLQRGIDCPLVLAERTLYDRLRTQRPQLDAMWLGDYG
jgi:hypothetical protein